MDKPKAAPQDLTLLDEFEENVETITGILENSISIIDQWIKNLPKFSETGIRFIPQRTSNDVIAIVESFYPFADSLPEIQRYLTTHVPQFESRVEKRYSDINKKIEEIVGKCGQDPLNPPPNPAIPYGEMTELRRYIEKLVGDLSFCVKEAREKSAKSDNGNGRDTNLPDYRALNLAKRTLTIGGRTYPITSEKVWDFIKDLCSLLKSDRIVAYMEGAVNNKNAVDQLRKLIGKENLHNFLVFVSGGYKLNPEVKILDSGQIGIRKTRLKRNTSDT